VVNHITEQFCIKHFCIMLCGLEENCVERDREWMDCV